jgi:hypothetical protein
MIMRHNLLAKVAAYLAVGAIAAVSVSPAGAHGIRQDRHGMTGANACRGKMNDKHLQGAARTAEMAKCMAAPEEYK